MTSSVGTSTGSMASMASSVFGSAKQALKSIAEAAAPAVEDTRVAAQTPARGGRRGTVLDRYL